MAWSKHKNGVGMSADDLPIGRNQRLLLARMRGCGKEDGARFPERLRRLTNRWLASFRI